MIERLTQQRKEQLLGDYFAGGMSVAEEQEFFVQVALDDDLRQMLKAHTIVRSALEKGHSPASVDHHTARAHLIATLEARHRQPAAEPAPSRRPALWWSAGLLVVTSLFVVAGLLLRPDTTLQRGADEVPAASIREIPAAKEQSTTPVMPPQQIDARTGKETAKEVSGTRGSVSAPATVSPLRAASRPSGTVVTPKATAASSTQQESDASTRVVTPALMPRSSADTIREKSRDTVTMRLKVRKIVE